MLALRRRYPFMGKVRLQVLPFPLRSVQVDGTSEFMADFETACQGLDIPLHVLPPGAPSTTAAWNAPTAAPASSSGTCTRAP